MCRPFDNATFAFRCPANCKRVEVVNPHAVGDQEINYRPLVIGGTLNEGKEDERTMYRGDSYICGSAIHAGYVSNLVGGCGVLRMTGEGAKYPSYKRHGMRSIGFDSYFPQSFEFVNGTQSQCRDLRWPLFAVSLTFTTLLSLFTTHVGVFFWSLFTGIFFHVGLASDPPNLINYYELVSIAIGRFLPASFCAFVLYRYCVLPQHTGLTAQIEKTVLWLGGCWIGALNNYTFDKIPIQRLTPHDIKQEPGAVPALIIVAGSLLLIALGQAWCLRVEGRLPRFLGLYALLVGGILALVAIPRMNVRIHHYILGLVLAPGTSMQTRPSLLFQGILVGLFINGIARWGFDSILQTPMALRGDAHLGTPLPHILPPDINNNYGPHDPDMPLPNITFTWRRPLPHPYDGVSVLVNDVERFRAYEDDKDRSFTWVRTHPDGGELDPRGKEYLPEYFRFAYLRGAGTADYTKAGTWMEGGRWKHMDRGPGLFSSEGPQVAMGGIGKGEGGKKGAGWTGWAGSPWGDDGGAECKPGYGGQLSRCK